MPDGEILILNAAIQSLRRDRQGEAKLKAKAAMLIEVLAQCCETPISGSRPNIVSCFALLLYYTAIVSYAYLSCKNNHGASLQQRHIYTPVDSANTATISRMKAG